MHISRHARRRYLLSPLERALINIALPAVLIGIVAFIAGSYANRQFPEVSFLQLLGALLVSVMRITIAYALCLVVGVALGMFSLLTPAIERIMLPIWDVLESIPVLVFFPAIIAVFIGIGGFSIAAICIMALSMVWNILFSTVGGLRAIPEDVRSLATVFDLTAFQKLKHIILPALFPSLVTGSLLATAEGWNMLMVAEVIHTYVPGGTEASDLFGIGSILVHASASGNMHTFTIAVGSMVAVVALMNICLWQPLLRYAEHFKFE